MLIQSFGLYSGQNYFLDFEKNYIASQYTTNNMTTRIFRWYGTSIIIKYGY